MDALEPQLVAALIEEAVLEVREQGKWDERVALQEEQKVILSQISDRYEDVEDFLNDF